MRSFAGQTLCRDAIQSEASIPIVCRLGRRRYGYVYAAAALLGICASTHPRVSMAIVVGSTPNFVPNTTTPPADNPGWNNYSTAGNYVYLGDGWVLSARHVGYSQNGMTFQTPSGPQTFHIISGSYYQDYGFSWPGSHQYAVSNPTSIQRETGQNLTLSPYTDLQLFRINGDPGLPSLNIATQTLPNTFTAGTAPQLLAIANGKGRATAETHWDVTGSSPNLTWTVTTGTGDHQGYLNNGIDAKRWGTNRASDPANSSNLFSGIVSNTAGVLPLTTGVGDIARDIISLITVYDKSGQTGTTSQEFQAINGDSGGAAFYKRGSEWELAGIINAQITYEVQPFATAMYGNATTMAALSYYNQNYTNSIRNIIETHPDYSIVGDVNLDGIVSGNGTGPASSDDVTAFITGWGFNNGTGTGTISSWKKGDLNRDGRTNVVDFLRLRDALNGQISGAVLATLFGGAAVPEPSAAVIALVGALLMSIGRRGRRSHSL